jgi:hypothetical protein
MKLIGTLAHSGIFTLLCFVSCTSTDLMDTAPSHEVTLITGRSAVQNLCLNCHTSGKSELAPNLAEVMATYRLRFPEKKQQYEHLKAFLSSPNEDLSLNKEWIMRYGLMPNMSYTANQLHHIAHYLVNSELSDLNIPLTTEEQALVFTPPEEVALGIVLDTRSVLGGTLMKAIQERGVDQAVEFCHLEAIPITQRKSTEHDVRLKRVSDRPRNPDNSATTKELAHIKAFNERLLSKEELGFVLEQSGDLFTFYSPILTNQSCLRCHGDPENDILSSTASVIKKLYPQDKATGYNANELRGLWKVEWSE